MKDFYDRTSRAPYLNMPSMGYRGDNEQGNPHSKQKSAVDGSHHSSSTQLAGSEQADVAGGSVLQRVSSFSLLGGGSSINKNRLAKNSKNNNMTPERNQSPEGHHKSPRHSSLNNALPPSLQSLDYPCNHLANEVVPTWRLKDRMKTVGVGLIMALNVGTDPPDVTKPHPCAKLQCWMDPTSVSRAKAKEKIGERLEMQYAKWQQQRAAKPLKYKRALDPTVDDVRSLCLGLRRQARHERILVHYNGHGVPRPTANGEIWVFDKNHTQYIPLSVTDLRQWMGKPSIVVLDCSSAGILMPFLTTPLEMVENHSTPPSTPPPQQVHNNSRMSSWSSMQGSNAAASNSNSFGSGIPSSWMSPEDMDQAAAQCVRDTIVLCPTSEGEWLPMHPEYPADIFTSCLTTPIQMALRWFVRRNPQSMGNIIMDPDAVDAIPGRANDRKTPLGELNWIFTAVTDSIAWNVLPKPLFSRLFRQDLLVASMFRNFLLADRIFRSLNCTPQSYPPLPPGVCDHPLWQAWDLACETCLHGLICDGWLGNVEIPPVVHVGDAAIAENNASTTPTTTPTTSPQVGPRGGTNAQQQQQSTSGNRTVAKSGSAATSGASNSSNISSPFFSEQLTAFEIWLEFASIHKHTHQSAEFYESPEQLPVVLQVLLSQAHRIRALVLLRRFLDLGPWAVNLALSLGIFPYVMKLLQSPEYKHVLVGIWAKILAFDPSCQVDLVKDGALPHFIHHLSWGMNKATVDIARNYSDASEQRTMAAFILSVTCLGYPQGQTESLRQNLHGSCCALFSQLESAEKAELASTLPEGGDPNVPPLGSNPTVSETIFSPSFRLWLCICIGNLVKDNAQAQVEAYGSGVHVRLFARIKDKSPDVRAAACYALGCLLGSAQQQEQQMGRDGEMSGMSGGPDALSGMLPSMGQAPGTLQPVSVPTHQGLVPSQLLSATGQPINMIPTNNTLPSGPMRLQPMQPMQPMQPTFAPQHPTPQWNAQPSHALPGQALHPQPGQPLHPQPLIQPQAFKAQPMPYNQTMTPHSGSLVNMPGGDQPYAPQVQPSLLNPQLGSGRGTEVPSVFEDRARLDLDLAVLEVLIKASKDSSPLVRYEATMAVACAVGKYLAAFAAVAEELATAPNASKARKVINVDIPKATGNADLQASRIPFPPGVEGEIADKFSFVWKELRSLQHNDLHPSVGCEANNVVSVVHDHILSLKMEVSENERSEEHAENSRRRKSENLNSEQDRAGNRANSDVGFGGLLPPRTTAASVSGGMNNLESSRKLPGGTDPDHLQDNENEIPLRRIASDYMSLLRSGSSPGSKTPASTIATKPAPGSEQFKIEYILPKSAFFEWKRDAFGGIDDDTMKLDNLSPEGAVHAYRERRNTNMHEMSRRIGERYAILAPKPPQPKEQAGLFLDEEVNAAAEATSTSRKQELGLRQSALLINEGFDRTSMLKFHPYEDALVVASGSDGISVWDLNASARGSTFKNQNPKGSRMTSTHWINEMSSSLFLVGSDDGSVRIWDGLLENNGEVSTELPSLCSAFFAAPDLVAGTRGSGLVTEWQPFSGKLIAGGNCESVYCWDLGSEQRVSTFERKSNACITTLTTAWDYDPYGQVFASEGYRGFGPDIVVAGYSDGCMKVFDIRVKSPLSNMSPANNFSTRRNGRRRAPPTEFAEHKSWIVDTSFTNFGGRNEIISGSVGGEVKAWDLRLSSSLRTLEVQRSPLTALATHSKIPMIASGSHAQFIKVLTLDGDALQVMRYHEKKSGHRIGPVSCLEFHPHKPLLAAGATDCHIGIYSPK